MTQSSIYAGIAGRLTGQDAWSLEATRMTIATRIDLAVPYARKEEAKALGARWDGDKRTWYAPASIDLRGFDRR